LIVAPELTSRQLVTRTLAGQPVPRVPAGPLAVHYCAKIAGRTVRQYTLDPQVLADCVGVYYQRFQPDALWISADTWVTAEAMGVRVGTTGDDQPFGGLGEPLVQKPGDIDRIPAPDPSSQGRWPRMLEAVRRVRRMFPDVFLVACFDQYPFSLACALMGIHQLMLKLTDDRPMVEALMERCLEYSVAYAVALSKEGADSLSGGDSPAGLIGPRSYRDLAAPFESRAIRRIQQATRKPVSLHICGDATALLADMASTGADVLEIDSRVDLPEACRQVGPGVALWGNLDPVALLARGTPEQVRRASHQAIEAVAAAGHSRFVLSSGCTLAMETPPENLDAMFQVARES
jgi:MtaA/CmuA family methyltransferase